MRQRFLEFIDNFLSHVIREPTRAKALLDPILINKEELPEVVKVGSSLGCSDDVTEHSERIK